MRKTLMLALLTSALIALTSSRPAEKTLIGSSVTINKPPIEITVPVKHTFTMLGCQVTISADIKFILNNNFQIVAVGYPTKWDIKVDCSSEAKSWQRPGAEAEFIVKDGALIDVILSQTEDEELNKIYANPEFKHNVLKSAQDAAPEP